MLPSSIIRLCSRTISRLIRRVGVTGRPRPWPPGQVSVGNGANLGIFRAIAVEAVLAAGDAVQAHQLASHAPTTCSRPSGKGQTGLEGAAALA